MAHNDFYDDDLIRERDRATRIKMGPGDEPAASASKKAPADGVDRPVSELNLTRMARHKQDVDTQTAHKLQELELLKKRQEQLELEKRDLEEFKQKSDEFERGKRDIITNIKRSLTSIERDELEAQRLQELIEATRTKYKALLTELESIREQSWTEENVREEVARALGIIDDARMEYNKAQTKIMAIKTERSEGTTPNSGGPMMFEESSSSFDLDRPFSHWFKMGVGLSMPLIITIAIVFAVYITMAVLGFF